MDENLEKATKSLTKERSLTVEKARLYTGQRIILLLILFSTRQRTDKETKAKAVKSNLENGLNLWRAKVLKVQSQSIKKVEERLKEEIEKKKERIIDERRKKEKNTRIMKRHQMQKQRKDTKTTKKRIIEKDAKVRLVGSGVFIIKSLRFQKY
jgi:alpha-N-acetylglucosamine transferase